MNNTIKKFVIEVGGVELSLSPDDAKKLWEGLNEIFGKPTVTVSYPRYPQYVPVSPRWPDYWLTYCSTDTPGIGTSGHSVKMTTALTSSVIKYLDK